MNRFFNRYKFKFILPIVLIIVFSCGCSNVNHLPTPAEFNNYPYGSYIQLGTQRDFRMESPSLFIGTKIEGELIAVAPDTLVMLSLKPPNQLLYIPKLAIKSLTINVGSDTNNPDFYKFQPIIFFINSLTHGYMFFPSIIINAFMSKANGPNIYKIAYPSKIEYEYIYKFARFPQGLPKQDLDQLILPPRLENKKIQSSHLLN